MTWLTPLAGLFLALAVIPPLILLYFLKLRRTPQPIASTLLWKRSVEDLRANAPFQRLRRSLLLFLQLLALLLLVLSVMQPQIHAGDQSGGRTVLLIDTSASMTSTDLSEHAAGLPAGATRLDEAKQRAREKIEAMYGGGLFASTPGQTMIVAFSDRAEVACRFTDSKQQLLAAIDRIEPTHGPTALAEALKLARAYTTNTLDEQGEPRLIADPPALELYSDGRIADMTEQVLRGESLNFHSIGTAQADNVGVGALAVERPFDRPNAVEVFAALLNYTTEPVACDIQLSVNALARGVESATIPAAEVDDRTGALTPGRANVVFTPFEQPRGAIIQVAALREDGLAADNVAQVVVAPPSRLVVGLVEPPGRVAVRRVLEGMRLERLEILTTQRFEDLAQQGAIDSYDVIVLDNYAPTTMPPGRYLSFGPTPPVTGLNEYGKGEHQLILSTRDDHPVMRYVNTDNLYISRFTLLEPDADVQVILEGSRSPALVAVSRGPLQIIHCPFDVQESNWPFQNSFVNFLINAVDYLGHVGEAITTRSLAPGQAITARLPASATNVTLLTPASAEPVRVDSQDPTQFAWGPIRLTGPYVLTWNVRETDEPQSRAFAVNLLSEAEGHIAANPVVQVGQERIAGRRSDESVYTPLWPWAIGLCLAVLMIEWWIYHRKAYI